MTARIVVIGAGPAGAVAAALLNKKGHKAVVLEKQHFPRFVIGESLLPYCMEILAEAGMDAAVMKQAGFQYKNGAAFSWKEHYTRFEFLDKWTPGPGTTFQVQRAVFDRLLAQEAEKQGVEIRFGHTVTSWEETGNGVNLGVQTEEGASYTEFADFVLDASGYGRVLPRLLDLEQPSSLPGRQAVFTHIDDRIAGDGFDRNKILITTHPEHRDVWFWLIPFANGRASLGVVGSEERLGAVGVGGEKSLLQQKVAQVPALSSLLADAEWDNDVPFRHLRNYSANVTALHGRHFALLGNAAEFLDPVFSSGVTIALHSARLAVQVLERQLAGEKADWDEAYARPLMVGVNAFRTYVEGWYDGRFQDVIYFDPEKADPEVRKMICSILAGYAWDETNPFVVKSERRLDALAQLCAEMTSPEIGE